MIVMVVVVVVVAVANKMMPTHWPRYSMHTANLRFDALSRSRSRRGRGRGCVCAQKLINLAIWKRAREANEKRKNWNFASQSSDIFFVDVVVVFETLRSICSFFVFAFEISLQTFESFSSQKQILSLSLSLSHLLCAN